MKHANYRTNTHLFITLLWCDPLPVFGFFSGGNLNTPGSSSLKCLIIACENASPICGLLSSKYISDNGPVPDLSSRKFLMASTMTDVDVCGWETKNT